MTDKLDLKIKSLVVEWVEDPPVGPPPPARRVEIVTASRGRSRRARPLLVAASTAVAALLLIGGMTWIAWSVGSGDAADPSLPAPVPPPVDSRVPIVPEPADSPGPEPAATVTTQAREATPSTIAGLSTTPPATTGVLEQDPLIAEGHSAVVAVTSGQANPIVAVPEDGNPVVAFTDLDLGHVVLAKCGDPLCESVVSLTPVATDVDPGSPTVAFGAAGYPIVTFRDLASDTSGQDTIWLVVCGDPACTGSRSVELGAGERPVVAVGTDGIPVVMYATGPQPVLVRCNDQRCSGHSRSVLPLGLMSFALREDGRPIAAGIVDGHHAFYSCDDSACETGTLTLAATEGGGIGLVSAGLVAVDGNGFPVAVLPGESGTGLYLARCGDPDCIDTNAIVMTRFYAVTVAGEGITFQFTLDNNGLPLVAMYAASNVYAAHCRDALCAENVDFQKVDSCVMDRATIAVGASGEPLVAYQLRPYPLDGSVRVAEVPDGRVADVECVGGGGG